MNLKQQGDPVIYLWSLIMTSDSCLKSWWMANAITLIEIKV